MGHVGSHSLRKRGAQKSPRAAAKTALVTGSTSGIDLDIARALASGGANLILDGFSRLALPAISCRSWCRVINIASAHALVDG